MNQKPFAKLLGYLIVCLIFSIILVIGPLVIADELYACWRMSSTVDGRITSSTIDSHDRINEDEPLFETTLVYAYEVQGNTFRNSHYGASWFTPGKENGPLFSAMWTKVSYPPGSPVIVHFDPSDPQRSCLHRGVSTWAIGLMLLSTGLLLFFLQQRFPRYSMLVKEGYATCGVFGGLILLLIGPRTMTLIWFIIFAVLFFVFLTTPGWRLFCRLLGRHSEISTGEPPSPLDQPLTEQEKVKLYQEGYPKS